LGDAREPLDCRTYLAAYSSENVLTVLDDMDLEQCRGCVMHRVSFRFLLGVGASRWPHGAGLSRRWPDACALRRAGSRCGPLSRAGEPTTAPPPLRAPAT